MQHQWYDNYLYAARLSGYLSVTSSLWTGCVFKSIVWWELSQFVYEKGQKKVALMLKDSLYSHCYLLRITLSVINQRSSRTSFTMFFPFLWMSFVRLTDFLQISAHSVNSWPKNENTHYLLIPMLLFFSSKLI